MKFYQGTDPKIGEPGFLSFHHQVRFSWWSKTSLNWSTIGRHSKLSPNSPERWLGKMSNQKLKKLKLEMISAFLTKMQKQIRKHNKCYLLTRNLVCTVFLELQMGQAVAQFLKGGDKGMPLLCVPFFSEPHGS
jgi:hypothetical protein